jgi:hypothetical protein
MMVTSSSQKKSRASLTRYISLSTTLFLVINRLKTALLTNVVIFSATIDKNKLRDDSDIVIPELIGGNEHLVISPLDLSLSKIGGGPGCGRGAGGCCRIMIEYSSILCLNSMDFFASNRQQQQQQQQQQEKAGPAGENFPGKVMISGMISGRISGHPIPISGVPISGYTCPDICIS